MESITGLPPEREREIIEKLARRIVDSGLGTMALMTLHSIAPLSFMGTQVGMVVGSPLLMTLDLLGVKVYEYAGLFAESTRSRENVERLIFKIEEFMKAEEEDQKKAREATKQEKKSWLIKLKDFLA